MLYDELYIVKVIKIPTLRWLEQLVRMQELDPCCKGTLLKPEGTLLKPEGTLLKPEGTLRKPEGSRSEGKLNLRRLESVKDDLKNVGMRNWRHK